MEVKPHQLLTVFAADELLIFITSVRYVTKFDATPLNTNLSIPDTTMRRIQDLLKYDLNLEEVLSPPPAAMAAELESLEVAGFCSGGGG